MTSRLQELLGISEEMFHFFLFGVVFVFSFWSSFGFPFWSSFGVSFVAYYASLSINFTSLALKREIQPWLTG